MKKLLITGFDPFGGESVNPSWEAVKLLPDQIGGYEIHKLQIPTVFGLAPRTVLEKAAEIQPDVIISVGQAGTRAAVTPERIGINIRDARIADNAGISPKDEFIVPGGPDGLFSTLPVKAMIAAIQAAGLPGAVSNTAGTFVCNDVLYSLLHHYAGTHVRCGFIHVPWLPQQGTPSLPLEDTVKALEAAVSAL
ncbi:MAG: pyroglutamyl-peptidase I [Ruminococcaceae bacterium]|nr:pyroglutamyl-peptidase I [Oscillospiraceae bacterium]